LPIREIKIPLLAPALLNNTGGTGNTGNGVFAFFSNTTGAGNTAVGSLALFSNTTAGSGDQGTGNTAIGYRALDSNTTGERNTAVGTGALDQNITGDRNTATGRGALGGNATGVQNTADGHDALFSNTGSYNTASGDLALFSKTTGDLNIALGESAGCNLATGDNNIYIGSAGVATESNTIRIGTVVAAMNCGGVEQSAHTATYVAGIYGSATMGGTPVYIDATGKLGTQTSSRRFKKEIRPMDNASEAIRALKPVTFQYRSDKTNTLQFGLVAEQVAAINPDLVVRDRDGEIYTVRYDAVNAMLLNEFLKEHRKVQDLDSTVTRQQKQIEALTSGLEKVSAQVGLIKPGPQVVLK
jgi:Chaperone of endosialidase